jgi:hypothetical protein
MLPRAAYAAAILLEQNPQPMAAVIFKIALK